MTQEQRKDFNYLLNSLIQDLKYELNDFEKLFVLNTIDKFWFVTISYLCEEAILKEDYESTIAYKKILNVSTKNNFKEIIIKTIKVDEEIVSVMVADKKEPINIDEVFEEIKYGIIYKNGLNNKTILNNNQEEIYNIPFKYETESEKEQRVNRMAKKIIIRYRNT